MTITETAVILLIISALSTSLSLSKITNPFLEDQFRSDVLHTQMLALAYSLTLFLDERWGIDVWYNANGNINRPQRIKFMNHEIILRLGTGRFDVPRLSDD